MFRRRQAKTQGRLMREELGESFEHLRLAVGHATGGAANLVGPRFGSAKRSVRPGLRKARRSTVATIVPLALAASGGVRTGLRGSARQAEKAAKAARKGKAKLMREEPRMRRWPMLLGGLLAAGAVVGAAGAVIARRRANRDQWEEYGTARSTSGRTDAMIESAKSTVDSGRDKVQSLADSAKERAGTSSSRTPSSPEFGSREDLYGKAGTGSNNSRS
jgi:hypothetical protein